MSFWHIGMSPFPPLTHCIVKLSVFLLRKWGTHEYLMGKGRSVQAHHKRSPRFELWDIFRHRAASASHSLHLSDLTEAIWWTVCKTEPPVMVHYTHNQFLKRSRRHFNRCIWMLMTGREQTLWLLQGRFIYFIFIEYYWDSLSLRLTLSSNMCAIS